MIRFSQSSSNLLRYSGNAYQFRFDKKGMIMNKELHDVLAGQNLLGDSYPSSYIADIFLNDWEKAMKGEEATCYFVPTYMSATGTLKPGETVTVMDAGGTNFRVAQVRFGTDGKAEILKIKKSRMPGSGHPITSEEMFGCFAQEILPMMTDSGKLAICFSYACRCLPTHESEIIEMSKEVVVTDAPGKLVGKSIADALYKLGYSGNIETVVINDTVAVLYSALCGGAKQAVAVILGTGENIAYAEKCSNFAVRPEGNAEWMFINTESAMLSVIKKAKIDAEIEAHSADIGKNSFEKMSSGAYIGEIIARSVVYLGENGFVSGKLKETAEKLVRFDMRDVGSFLESGTGTLKEACLDENDTEVLKEVCEQIEKRSGNLVAGNTAAGLIRMRKNGVRGVIPVAVNGSTILKAKIINTTFIEALNSMKDRIGEYEIITDENDTIIGTAASVFLK